MLSFSTGLGQLASTCERLLLLHAGSFADSAHSMESIRALDPLIAVLTRLGGPRRGQLLDRMTTSDLLRPRGPVHISLTKKRPKPHGFGSLV